MLVHLLPPVAFHGDVRHPLAFHFLASLHSSGPLPPAANILRLISTSLLDQLQLLHRGRRILRRVPADGLRPFSILLPFGRRGRRRRKKWRGISHVQRFAVQPQEIVLVLRGFGLLEGEPGTELGELHHICEAELVQGDLGLGRGIAQHVVHHLDAVL